jgi:hypothetical protein
VLSYHRIPKDASWLESELPMFNHYFLSLGYLDSGLHNDASSDLTELLVVEWCHNARGLQGWMGLS